MPDEIVRVPEEHVKLGMLDVAPEQVVNRATKIANALADVIKQKGLSSKIRNKEYVRVEGWSTLGAMIGVLPKESYVKVIENGYEAGVELIRASDGVVIGGASAICTRDERNWSDRDDFAVRSMAITRATGKAYRLGMAWIMELAGYSGTPAEEMYDTVVEAEVKEVRQPFSGPVGSKGFPADVAERHRKNLIKAKVLPPDTHNIHFATFLDLTPFGPNAPTKDIVAWGKLYRGYKDETGKTDEAVRMANAAWGSGDPE